MNLLWQHLIALSLCKMINIDSICVIMTMINLNPITDTFVLIWAFDNNVSIQLLQLSVEGLQLALGAAQLRVDLLDIPLVRGGPAQILRALLDLQLLPDLPADPLAVLIQALLHATVGEVGVLVQTELLEHRQPIGISLKRGKTRENLDSGEHGERLRKT